MVYLELFHGRSTEDEVLDDWGEEGPVLGPFPFVHVTYGCHIKCQDSGLDLAITPGGLVPFGSKFYGDWSVFDEKHFHSERSLVRRHQSQEAP